MALECKKLTALSLSGPDYYRANVAVAEAKVVEITRGQSSTDDVTANMWLTGRHIRITSSITGTIAKRRSTTKVGILVKTLLYQSFRGNAAMQYGHDQEAVSQEAYLRVKRMTSLRCVYGREGWMWEWGVPLPILVMLPQCMLILY